MGSSGFWVSVAQRDLTLVGYPLEDTGSYGQAMKTQVSRFKKNHRLQVKGGLGTLAWHAYPHLRKAAHADRHAR